MKTVSWSFTGQSLHNHMWQSCRADWIFKIQFNSRATGRWLGGWGVAVFFFSAFFRLYKFPGLYILHKFFTVKYLRDHLIWWLLSKCTIVSACSFINSSWPQPYWIRSWDRRPKQNCKIAVQVLLTDYAGKLSLISRVPSWRTTAQGVKRIHSH